MDLDRYAGSRAWRPGRPGHLQRTTDRRAKTPIEPALPASRWERRIRRDADQGLAEVLTTQHLGEGGGDNLQSLADILAVTDLARGDPGRHLGQERVVPLRRVRPDGEIPHPHAARFGTGAFLG